MSKLKLAIVGLGQRGRSLLKAYLIMRDDAEIALVCDLLPERAAEAAEEIEKAGRGRPRAETDWRKVLRGDIDAVIVSTPWESHVEIAAAAMRAGRTVGLEVGGAYSVLDCAELVRAYEETGTPILFLENCCYNKDELLALKLARTGVLGEVVHCSGAYSHDLRREIAYGRENKHYRLDQYLTRNCENYPTHELGPIAKILDINRGNRMVSLVSMPSKAVGMERYVERNADKVDKALEGKRFLQGDIIHTLIKCERGETIALKLDTTLPGFYSRDFTVRGTDGMYWQGADMVVVDGIDNTEDSWEPTETLGRLRGNAARYGDLLPPVWRNMTEDGKATGHGGMDGIMLREFLSRAKTGAEMPIDAYDAAAWMAVTALSEESIKRGGAPIPVPDFTGGKWRDRPRLDVM
jgi:hypothetical protein